MDNYGNDYFMSQEGYASIDFTLLDRPNSNIASAPESTAALLPDLHVADSTFSSFDFLDGPSVDAFGGVLRDADEAHSRDQGGYRSDLQKYKKERSVLQNSVPLHRGDGDPDSELPSSEFHIPFEVQRPISNVDFFSQGHTKESGHQEQQAQADPGNDVTDGNHDYFEQGQMSQQTHAGTAGAGGWYNTWSGSNTQGDQTQVFFQTPSYDEASDERRLMQMKGNTSQVAGQMGYHSLPSPQVPSSDPVPKATHSFLPAAKQSDSRQASNMGLGLASAQVNVAPSSVVKSSPRNQPFDYEGLMNGSSTNQFRQNPSAAVENTASAGRHQNSDANLGGQDTLRSHGQSQSYKYAGQNLGSLAPVEVSPLKVNDYDFLGSQYALKGQAQGEIGQQQLAVDEMQAWHQHPLLSQSNPQQTSYQQPYQDLSRQHQNHVDQQSQHTRQQNFQQLMGVNHQSQSLGNQLSAFLSESSLQDLPRVAERQNPQLAVENPRGLLQTNYQPINNMANLNWSSSDPSAMEGLAHDYLMGADQNFNWQALALKASQVDPALYGSLPGNRRDTTGQPLSAYTGMQGGLQEYYTASGKLAGTNAQVGKPVARNLGGSGGSGGSLYGGEYQAEVYDAAANLQTSAQNSKHQALGKMPFWQNPYPQSVEHSRSGNNLSQTNLPPRSPQVPANSQVRQQRNWSGLSGQQEALQGGLFAQNLANAEALKQSLLAGSSVQQNSHQAANPRPSARSQSVEPAHYIQQSSSQAASGSQFLSSLGTKQQSNWNRLQMQQTGVSPETPSVVESNQKNNWTSLNIHQASAETQSLSNLKQQNIWSGHNVQQSSRPAANSLHLFTDLDGRRNSMHSSHDLQQGSQPSGAQQAGKIDVNLQSSHNMQSNEPPNTLLDLDTSQQSGWRDHSLLQGTSQTSNSLQTYNDLDKTSSWRSIWQTPSVPEGSSQLLEMDDARQQSTLWGHSVQKSSSQAVESQVATINSREHNSWSGQDVQQESPQTDQLLSSLDTEQQGSRRSHTLDERHQSGQFAHLLREEHTRSKSSAEADARHKASQSAYNLQPQAGTAETDVRQSTSHNAYNLQSQVGTETDVRQTASHNAYNLQTQVGTTEADSRHKARQSAYSLQSQVGLGETDRHRSNLSIYNLQSHLATAETDVRHNASQNAYNLQSQVGITDTDSRHKPTHNAFSLQSQVGLGEKDPRQRSSQNNYNLQSHVGTLETDAQHKGRHSAYNLQSQAAIAESDVRQKGSKNAYSLQAQVGAYSQPSNIDGRQGRSQWAHTSQQGNSQSGTSMYVFPSMSAENQTAQNSLNLHAWNASVNNVDSWQKSSAGGSGHFQQMDLSQVETADARHQSARSGSNSHQSNLQNENHLQSVNNSRPPSRLGRLNSSLDNSLSGTMGAGSVKPGTASHWQAHGNNINSTSGSQGDVLPTWSQGQTLPGRGDVEKFNSVGETTSGTSDGLPAWSRGQTLPAQQDIDQLSLGGESNSDPNEVSQTWPHGQTFPGRKDLEQQFNFGEESQSSIKEVQPMWSRGQNMSTQKDVEQLNLVMEPSSGLDEGTPSWAHRQNVPAESELEQLNLGQESNSELKEEGLPAWSRGQSTSTQKDVEDSNAGGEADNVAKELPIWSRGQNMSTRSVVDQLNLGVELSNDRNEVVPAWSRGKTTPPQKDAEQFNLAGETNMSGNDAVPTWSRGQSIPARKDAEQLNLEGESNIKENESLPAWSRGQSVLSQKDAEQLNQAGDSNSGGTNNSGKDLLNPRLEAEKRTQAEMTFLDGGTLRESNSTTSPAPSPESNLFTSAVKQKSSTKVSSLSRNTLELLSKPEETNESTSMNVEEEEEEELDLEDSGANASSISLAHLRRNQASGPLSPQGFGLRLAPPSHLSQNMQAGNSSRLVSSTSNLGADVGQVITTQTGQEQLQSKLTSGSDQAFNHQKSMSKEDQLDPAVPIEDGTSSIVPVTTVATAATANSHLDSRLRSQEFLSAEVLERSSGGSSQLDGSTSQPAPLSDSTVKSGAQQAFLGVQNSVETGHPGAANTIAPVQIMDSTVSRESEDGNANNHAFGASQANMMGHFSSSISQKDQYASSNAPEQTAALSKLLSSFKDSLTGPTKQTSAQQQIGIAEKGNAGVFESFRAVGKQVNGLQPAHWSIDPAQISSSVKAELYKRLAAQNKSNQTVFGQMSTSTNSLEQTTTGNESFPGQIAGGGHYVSGQQAYPQGPILPGQGMTSGQSHAGQPLNQGQTLPGHEITAALSHSGHIYNQGYNLPGHGITMDKPDSGHLHTQGRTLSGQVMVADQSHTVQSQTPAGQASFLGQSYSGQFYTPGQTLPGQSNIVGHSYPGQMYSASQGQGHSPLGSTTGLSHSGQMFLQGNKFPGQSITSGQAHAGPETPGQPGAGQVISSAMASKQNRARQQRKLPQKAAGNDASQIQMQGRLIPQQSSGFPSQHSTAYPAQQSPGFQSQQALLSANNSLQFQYSQAVQQNDLSSSTQVSQHIVPLEAQPASMVRADSLGSKIPRADDSNKGSEATEKSESMLGSMDGGERIPVPSAQSSLEQYGPRPENQSNYRIQWQNAQSLNAASGLSDYQFQRILEARPALAAALEPFKGDPQLYQAAAAQLRSNLGQAHMARQLGQYQQQARDQSAISGSAGVVKSFSGGSGAAHAVQAAQVQVAHAAKVQAAHAAQVQAAHAAQVQAAHAAQSMQASQAVQAHNVQTATEVLQAAQVAQAAQAVQAAQAIHAAQSGQAADQAAEGVQAAQAAQAAIINKNANTAARLHYLSQVAQRGQTVNGMASPWFSGLVSRSGSSAAQFPSRITEGKGPDPAVANAPIAAAMARSGNDDPSGNRLFPQNSFFSSPSIKKRKEYPALPPWREAISQAGGYVSSTSGSEQEWAAATNRIPDTEPYEEVVDATDTRGVVLSRAKRRLRLTTHLMQQITPPVPATFMQSHTPEDREGATYTLSKLAFAEACRISSIARRIREVAAARDAEESRIEKERELAMKEAEKSGENVGRPMPLPVNIADRFKLRIKHLENDLQRLETSPSAVDLVKDMQDTERISLVNRLAEHHSPLHPLQNSDSPHRAVPQKYVTALQMPNKLPDGLLCVSL